MPFQLTRTIMNNIMTKKVQYWGRNKQTDQ